MLNEKMEAALNEQINWELYSAYLYKSMAAYYRSINLPGFANWMEVQVLEELVHGEKLYTLLNERGGRAQLIAIEAPPAEWSGPAQPFEDAYGHETKVTARISKLVDLAIKHGDHATNSYLQWFVNEQVEEEASTDAVVRQLELMGEAPGGLFMIDQQLAQRVFVPPPAQGQAGA